MGCFRGDFVTLGRRIQDTFFFETQRRRYVVCTTIASSPTSGRRPPSRLLPISHSRSISPLHPHNSSAAPDHRNDFAARPKTLCYRHRIFTRLGLLGNLKLRQRNRSLPLQRPSLPMVGSPRLFPAPPSYEPAPPRLHQTMSHSAPRGE